MGRPASFVQCLLSVAVALQVAAAAQTAPPPLLTTTPMPPPGAQSDATSMSGLPLQVDDLPAGTVAVRLIRGSFADNVVDHPVELQVLGLDGLMLEQRSDKTGRAIFENLPVGRTVFTRTTIDGVKLMSQQFELPPRGGVRLVLVAPGAAATATGAPVAATAAVPAAAAAPAGPPAAAPSKISQYDAGSFAAPLLALVTVGVAFWWLRPRRRVAFHDAGYTVAEPGLPVDQPEDD